MFAELPPCHQPMLALGDLRNQPIDSPFGSLRSTRTPFSISELNKGVRVGHRPDGDPHARASGTHDVESLSRDKRKRGSSPPLPPLALIPSVKVGARFQPQRERRLRLPRRLCWVKR